MLFYVFPEFVQTAYLRHLVLSALRTLGTTSIKRPELLNLMYSVKQGISPVFLDQTLQQIVRECLVEFNEAQNAYRAIVKTCPACRSEVAEIASFCPN